MSLVMCVLPKPRNMETEALEWCEVTSKTAALGDLDVAATLEAFARGQRGPGFGQHAVTSSPTYRLNGSALHISAFRSRLGFDQPSPGYGPARRRENSRLFPPFPPLTAFGGSFVFVKNVYTHPPSRRRFGATRNTQNTQTEPDGALAFPRGHHLRPGRARSPGTARSERRALPANAARDGGAPGANLPLHKGFPAFTLTRCVCVSSNLPATLESSHERRPTVP
jgi:hypothetical protein